MTRELSPRFSLSRIFTISSWRPWDSYILTSSNSSSGPCIALGGLSNSFYCRCKYHNKRLQRLGSRSHVTYWIGRNTVSSFGNHAISQSSKKFPVRFRTGLIGSNEMTEENGPEIVFPRLGEVVLESHSGLSFTLKELDFGLLRQPDSTGYRPFALTSSHHLQTHPWTISFVNPNLVVSPSRLFPTESS